MGPYIAKLSVMKDFASEGSYCVKVTVRLEGLLAGSSPECVVLMCKLLETPVVEKGFTYLPLMVVSGNASVSQVVMDWVRSCFDCCVRVANLEQSSLLSIASKYATAQSTNGHSGKHVEGLTLTYDLPEAVRKAGLSSIVLDFPSDSTAILAQDNSLCHTLQQTIHNHFHLNFSSLNLVAVSMPVFKMNHRGTVKVLFCNQLLINNCSLPPVFIYTTHVSNSVSDSASIVAMDLKLFQLLFILFFHTLSHHSVKQHHIHQPNHPEHTHQQHLCQCSPYGVGGAHASCQCPQ